MNRSAREERRVYYRFKKDHKTVCSWNLPEEISLNIFSRLQIRYVLRCMCVCKSWQTIISDPYLVSMHLACAPLVNDPYLLLIVKDSIKVKDINLNFYPDPYHGFQISPTTKLYTAENVGCIDEAVKPLPMPPVLQPQPPLLEPPIQHMSFGVEGSCNGLLCLNSLKLPQEPIYVWNPFTGHISKLPSFSTKTIEKCYFSCFGHSYILNEYKILAFVLHNYTDAYYSGYSSDDEILTLEAEVLTLGSDSWRRIRRVPYPPRDDEYISTNGAFHWLSLKQDELGCQLQIGSFDLAKEKFQLILLPSSMSNSFSVNIGALGGCLSAVDYSSPKHVVEVWTMKQYGVQESWTRQYEISMHDNVGHLRPLCLLKCGTVLFDCNWGELVLYDPGKRQIRKIGLRRSSNEPKLCFFNVIVHSGTLVSPMWGNEVECTGNKRKLKNLSFGNYRRSTN